MIEMWTTDTYIHTIMLIDRYLFGWRHDMSETRQLKLSIIKPHGQFDYSHAGEIRIEVETQYHN